MCSRSCKCLICVSSDFLDELCDSNFVEGASYQVTLDDEDPAFLVGMLLTLSCYRHALIATFIEIKLVSSRTCAAYLGCLAI